VSKTSRLSLALAVCLFATTATGTQLSGVNGKAELIKVTDHVYCATGYALGNVIYAITDKSVVVIDTTESAAAARLTLEEFRKVSTLPISYIIYTHHHGDHINGAKAFKAGATKIIAQKEFARELAKYSLLADYNRRLNAIQFGAAIPEAERGVKLAPRMESGYVPPDILFDDEYSFGEGGMRFELYHTLGETLDHLMVWMPGEQVLCPGDLFYQSYPMLASPMKPDRPVAGWAESLERMRRLHPAFLVGSHSFPLKGKGEIDVTLANYAKAIRYVHDETIRRINQGQTLEEIRASVRLPDELARLAYLAPVYGRIEWAINGIYRQYTGWYDFNPSHLNPGSEAAIHRALVEASGGTASLMKRAEQAARDGQPQLVLELTDVVLDVEPDNRRAHLMRAEALDKLASAAVNGVERNVYRVAAQEHRKRAGK
jgi:alkyl sulfatase BDS1-like metallo-beta-lactamase superfamily hydrolase